MDKPEEVKVDEDLSSSDSDSSTETDKDGYENVLETDTDKKTSIVSMEESDAGSEVGERSEGDSPLGRSKDEDTNGGGSEKTRRRRNTNSDNNMESKSSRTEDEDETTDPGSEFSERSEASLMGSPPGTPMIKKKVVRFLIKSAKNLREIPGKKKIIVPYANVTFNGQKETFKCKLQNTLLPVWNAKSQFLYGADTDENILKFQVFDQKGQTKDELLGECSIEISKLDWKKKRFMYTDHKLTHPKNEVQGKLSFILLVGERNFPVENPTPRTPTSEKDRAKEEKKKMDTQKKLEEKAKRQEEKAKKEAEKKERKAKALENGKGTLSKNSKPSIEKHTFETKAGIAAPPDLLWNFISNFHEVEEWLPKMPFEALPDAEDGKLRRKIKYPDYDIDCVEQLDLKDDPNMTLRWSNEVKEGEKGLAGTMGYSFTLIIAPVGRTRSRLTWQVDYELPVTADDEEAQRFFQKLIEIGMDGLKVAAEG